MRVTQLTSTRYALSVLKPHKGSIAGIREDLYLTDGSAKEQWRLRQQQLRFLSKSTTPKNARHIPEPSQKAVANSNGMKSKLAQREFMLDVLNASATRRDAKQYLSRFKSAPRAIEESPNFQQDRSNHARLESSDDIMHVALVNIRAPQTIDDDTLNGVALTLSQLVRLDMRIVLTIDCNGSDDSSDSGPSRIVQTYHQQGHRIVKALERHNNMGARYVDSALEVQAEAGKLSKEAVSIAIPKLFSSLLDRTAIPVIPMLAASPTFQTKIIDSSQVMMAFTKYLSQEKLVVSRRSRSRRQTSDVHIPTALDRIIMIDPLGGLPSFQRQDKAHVFVNLEQEYSEIVQELSKPRALPNNVVKQHLRNIEMLRQTLALLPVAASALIVSPEEASISSQPTDRNADAATTGTRQQKNPLIHNLLTNKPVISSSLPVARLASPDLIPTNGSSGTSQISRSTLVKHGMPLTMIPDPRIAPWLPPANGETTIDLQNHPQIDFPKLLALIEDSFRRKLNVPNYLFRIQNRIAGIIIAGDYEGGAIMTWEPPPEGSSTGSEDVARLVPYLDKFAVLQRSQGSSGVADIVFQALIRSCFPEGVCWRSRKDNPVNKWYFERSRGSWKIPGGGWTMFWTTDGLVGDQGRWEDYVGVCRGVEPSWVDSKKPD